MESRPPFFFPRRSQASFKALVHQGISLKKAAQAASPILTKSRSCAYPTVYPRLLFNRGRSWVHHGATQRASEQGGSAARTKEYPLADGDGLYLRVRPTGKAWVYRYKRHGKEAKLSIGHYPVVTLAAARRKARAEAPRHNRQPTPRLLGPSGTSGRCKLTLFIRGGPRTRYEGRLDGPSYCHYFGSQLRYHWVLLQY